MTVTSDNMECVDGPMEKAAELRLLPSWMVCLRPGGGARLAAAGTAGGRRPPDSATSFGARSRQASSFCAGSNAARLVDRQRDSGLARLGIFSFPSGGMLLGICPVWIAALWANFAGTLHLCLGWLRGRYWLASALGACGGPLAYYGGQRLGAIQFGGNTVLSLALITVEWAIVTPGLVYLSRTRGLDGLQAVTADAQG